MSNNNIALELRNITKCFGSVVANKNVNLDLRHGEILSILGENGSGKTTLMNMISGIYFPDDGEILINGEKVVIGSPKDAYKYKIGMIHQHFKLVDVFSAAENVVLGINNEKFQIKKAIESVRSICDKYGFEIDPKKKIYEMSVSEKQTVEIIKVLYRGADILILDEPTAVLTPQETKKLFAVLRRMRDDGKAIIIITHKMHEVLDLSDRVAILRRGEHIATVNTAETNESELTEMMVGKQVALNIDRPLVRAKYWVSQVSQAADSVSFLKLLRDFSILNPEKLIILTRLPGNTLILEIKHPCRSEILAYASRLFLRTDWVWVLLLTWILLII